MIKDFSEIKKQSHSLLIENLLLTIKDGDFPFWSFDSLRAEHSAAGTTLHYIEKDTPKGFMIREFPSGEKKKIKLRA
jgi:hypothetical protein